MGQAIDTGTAVEIYCDDIGSVEVQRGAVYLHGVRIRGKDSFINVTVILPVTAVPSIAKKIAAAFTALLSSSLVEHLHEISTLLH